MFAIISLKPLRAKGKTILKILLLIGFLCYIIPKLVLAVSGPGYPPAKEKLRDDPIRAKPMKVENKNFTCS